MKKLSRQAYFRSDNLHTSIEIKSTLQWIWEELVAVINRKVDKFTITGPPTNTTTWVITHGLQSLDVTVSMWDASTQALIYPDVTRTDKNNITITSGVTMTANAFQVVIHG